jgi:hypothetical protein
MSITVAQAETKLNIKARRIRVLCDQKRIPGAEKVGRDWVLPDNPVVTPAANPRPGKAPIAEVEDGADNE